MINTHRDASNLVHLTLPIGFCVNIVVRRLVVLDDIGDVLLCLNRHAAIEMLMPKLRNASRFVLGKNSCVDHVKKGARLLAQPLSIYLRLRGGQVKCTAVSNFSVNAQGPLAQQQLLLSVTSLGHVYCLHWAQVVDRCVLAVKDEGIAFTLEA